MLAVYDGAGLQKPTIDAEKGGTGQPGPLQMGQIRKWGKWVAAARRPARQKMLWLGSYIELRRRQGHTIL